MAQSEVSVLSTALFTLATAALYASVSRDRSAFAAASSDS